MRNEVAAVPGMIRRSLPAAGLGVRRGVARQCPACGQGKLFAGYLTVQPVCPACGNANDAYPSDDFAPYVTIFVVLHLLVPVLLVVDRVFDPTVWWEAAFALPAFTAATLLVLPFAKGGVIGLSWGLDVTRAQTGT